MAGSNESPGRDIGHDTPSPKRPAPRGTAFYPRKRAVTACQVCRARRTKCDNRKPACSFCLKTGATCIQSPTDLSSFDPASLKILERLDDVENLIRLLPAQNESDSLSNCAIGDRSHREHSSEGRIPAVPGQTRSGLSSVLPERPEDVLAWPVFANADSGRTQMKRDVMQLSSQGDPAVPGAPSPTDLASLLEDMPQRAGTLIENFFCYVHVKNPILDEAATRRLISTTIVEGVDWSPASCLTLLVCALGSIASPFVAHEGLTRDSPAYCNGRALFHAAERRLGACIGSGDLVAAQCLFLSGVYMMCVFQPRKAWKFFNLSLAACQEFPCLQQSPLEIVPRYHGRHGDGVPDDCHDADGDRERILQQALYWSSWKSERELRGELYLPDFRLADADRGLYPAFFPTPPSRQDKEPPADSLSPKARHEAAAWYFYLAEISLRRLSSSICAEMLSLRQAHQDDDSFLGAVALAVPMWEMQAQRWVDSLPSLLSLDTPAAFEDDICRFVLRGHLINLFELIYWPFVTAVVAGCGASPVPGRINDAQLQQCNGMSQDPGERPGEAPFVLRLASKGLETHARRILVNEPGFRHRHHGTWYMIRSCTRSALILVASAICLSPCRRGAEGEGSPEILVWPEGWRDSVTRVLRLLAYWEPEVPDLWRARRELEHGLSMPIEQQMG
ncbi:Glucan-beta-glucosidase [Pleurostoma richardsiae]|uniref:Glucan-beta-glucosidase n=1 Tax=Pleurostoma richardsiae TaxID=41990 RepID=A0AA38RTR8_9PEZI|nr:Glucan-beta-glucosidase [Pleurostoma richardsiae]